MRICYVTVEHETEHYDTSHKKILLTCISVFAGNWVRLV